MASLSHVSAHTQPVGGTAAALPWIPVLHLVYSGVLNVIECVFIEANTTTLIEMQLKSKHFFFIYPKVYSSQRKRTRKTTINPTCVLPLLHHSCISSCHPPEGHRFWVWNAALLSACSPFACQFSMMGAE